MRMLFVAGLIVVCLGCSSPTEPPLSPEDAIGTFEIHPAFEIELFAAEPDVVDPAAMEFDADGRIYIVENSAYPLDVDALSGRVKLLEDTGGDGRPDKTTVFADKLRMPTGVMAWKRGILVTDAPDVLYLEDTDGDGQADVRQPILTGFAFTNPQHTVSSPVFGLDNWIYLSHEGYTRAVVFSKEFGDTGTEIFYPDRPDNPRVPVTRRSVRFRPDSHQLELTAGPSQFGMAFDAWGAVFTHNNSNHSRHEVIAARYLERNPALQVGQPAHDMFEEPNPAPVFPITRNPRFEMLTEVGAMTSASGLTRYLGGKFPGFEDVAFVAECAHNLVHADRWSHDGSTFVARRLEPADKEFLASTDAWFRPVNFTIGPDGALYVLDYYREVVEHPEWTSAEIHHSHVLYTGAERGRIWRITPKGGLPFEKPRLSDATAAELVRALASPNIWYRRTAQRLLIERQDRAAVEPLSELAANEESTVGRLHALWALEGLNALDAGLVEAALDAAEPGVRKNAIQLAEPYLGTVPELVTRLLAMEDDPDAHVRLQLVLTLGSVGSSQAAALRDRILFSAIDDEWLQAAALSWPSIRPARLLARALATVDREATPGRRAFLRRLGAMTAAGQNSAEINALLRAVTAEKLAWRQASALEGLAQGLGSAEARQAVGESERAMVLRLAGGAPSVQRAALGVLEEVGLGSGPAADQAVRQALGAATSSEVDTEQRAAALRLLALADPAPHADIFREIIADSAQPEGVHAAAVRAYGQIDSDAVAPFLLERFRQFTGQARTEAAEAMYRHPKRLVALVDGIERGDVQPWMLTGRQKNRLIMSTDPALRVRARELLAGPPGDRQAVLDTYRAALEMEADAERGRQVFERTCSKCHAIRGEGEDVGPDLGTVATRIPLAILTDIIVPNQSIAQTYESYVVETTDGRILDGVIGPQGPGFVTLRREGGEEDVIQRSDIKEMRAAQLSAMPEDLDKQVTVEEMADLIRFIKSAH